MEIVKGKCKKNLIHKTWEQCKSICGGRKKSPATPLSPNSKRKSKTRVTPEGCFSVYVGPQKQRFVIKTKFANHPLFKILLEDAELEYGYNREGPITLPCEVDLFVKVLAEIDSSDEIHPGCGFAGGHGSFSFLSPLRRPGSGSTAKDFGSYGLLTPSRMLKMNQF